jgi:hypothetical protein
MNHLMEGLGCRKALRDQTRRDAFLVIRSIIWDNFKIGRDGLIPGIRVTGQMNLPALSRGIEMKYGILSLYGKLPGIKL